MLHFTEDSLFFYYLYYNLSFFYNNFFVLMSFDTEHKTIQMEEATSHDQLALDALERRRAALDEVKNKKKKKTTPLENNFF
jgi:hypothetical protein